MLIEGDMYGSVHVTWHVYILLANPWCAQVLMRAVIIVSISMTLYVYHDSVHYANVVYAGNGIDTPYNVMIS